MKPHIWYALYGRQEWVCHSVDATGYGVTPLAAFMQWELSHKTHELLLSTISRSLGA